MRKLRELIDVHGANAVEMVLWWWAGELGAERRNGVERALAVDGVWSVSEIDGLDEDHLAECVVFVEAHFADVQAEAELAA